MKDKIILTDCDGVVLDWEYAFDVWMQEHGFTMIPDGKLLYEIGPRYGITKEQGKKLIKIFNESASIGFLPSLRDAQYYVKKLHEKHGYRFHLITSLSKNENAQKLRVMNIEKLFGKTAFIEYVFLDTGADKDEALAPYRDTGCWWIEDKFENALAGMKVGLNPLVVEHGHNMKETDQDIPLVKNWKDIYNRITK